LKPSQAIAIINRQNRQYPNLLIERLCKDAPVRLWAIGSPDLIDIPKIALFCSKICPGDAILQAMDQAQKWRDQGRCIISGFHSPIEKECLQILLRGRQPIIICPARSLERMRIPTEWREGIKTGRTTSPHRRTFGTAQQTGRCSIPRSLFSAHHTGR